MSTLTNKTLFISGASRGIGLAIAKRAAQDGANVILAAKTAEPHPKLPGTIYTAAEFEHWYNIVIVPAIFMKLDLFNEA